MELREIVVRVNELISDATGQLELGLRDEAQAKLKEVAAMIGTELGDKSEVAAASPEGDEKPEEEQAADLLIVVEQIEELVSVVRGAVTSGHSEAAIDSLVKLAELITKTLATESG